jgi:hypothetical protein
MSFFTIIIRGLLRRLVRTGLTLVGISIGIAAVVALVGVGWRWLALVGVGWRWLALVGVGWRWLALVGISRGFEQSWSKGMVARSSSI